MKRIATAVAVALAFCASAHAVAPEIIVGGSYHSPPENGSWWDADVGTHKFYAKSWVGGIGLQGNHWSVELVDLGIGKTTATLEGATWAGSQHPRGLWAIWEPGNRLFAQLGLGVYRPQFTMHITPTEGTPYDWGNDHVYGSYLVGAGYRIDERLSVVANIRYTAANGNDTAGDYIGLGKFTSAVALRVRF